MKNKKPAKPATPPVYNILIQKLVKDKKIHILNPNFFTRA